MSLNWRISTSDDNTTPAYSFAPGFVERPANKVFIALFHGFWTRSYHHAEHKVPEASKAGTAPGILIGL